MKNDAEGKATRGQFLVYQAENGKVKIEVRLEDETVWLTQQYMAELFQTTKQNISLHINNVYEEGELQPDTTVKKYLTVRQEGNREVKRLLDFYNLDMIISIGYRVKSNIATHFRIWATQRLKEYIIKGFVLDDERFKNNGGGNYFEELLDRIRDIRSSEKVFWRKVLDIYATSIDYDPNSEISRDFFKKVQNKMHWAAHGHTAAEIIFERVDSSQKNLGLSNWSGARIKKSEVTIAKNYLTQEELQLLNRIVTAYLELAEIQAMNQQPMYMKDWVERLDMFLKMTGRELLDHAGKISHEQAYKRAQIEYEKYKRKQLSLPTEVEKHFVEAERELKKLADKKGKR